MLSDQTSSARAHTIQHCCAKTVRWLSIKMKNDKLVSGRLILLAVLTVAHFVPAFEVKSTRASVVSLRFMNRSTVLVTVEFLRKVLTAHITFEVFLSKVNASNMLVQVVLSFEWKAASVANEFSLIAVN